MWFGPEGGGYARTICHKKKKKKKNTPVWPVSHQSEHAAVTVFLLWLATLMKANETNPKSTDSTGDYFPGGLIPTGWHTDWCRGQRRVTANWRFCPSLLPVSSCASSSTPPRAFWPSSTTTCSRSTRSPCGSAPETSSARVTRSGCCECVSRRWSGPRGQWRSRQQTVDKKKSLKRLRFHTETPVLMIQEKPHFRLDLI